MYTLYHHPFCPHSRFIRVALAEHGIEPRLMEERVWERRHEFLLMNPGTSFFPNLGIEDDSTYVPDAIFEKIPTEEC